MDPVLADTFSHPFVVAQVSPPHPFDRRVDPIGDAGRQLVEPGLEWTLATLGDEELYCEHGSYSIS